MNLPQKLQNKLEQREENNSLRRLNTSEALVDFSSNDYLGFAQSEKIFDRTHKYLVDHNIKENSAGGSRLLTGNHRLYETLEDVLKTIHNSEAALIFNSGYDANLGLLSSFPQRGDLIFYDELCHASIRDGIRMCNAKSYKFDHNDLEHLEALLDRHKEQDIIYVVTESVFSMDGDSPDLDKLTEICEARDIMLILDEAHAVGVIGERGEGLAQMLGVEQKIFARLVTFGKALGVHGAAVLGSNKLKEYLVNFARSLIYTTALPPHTLATIMIAYSDLQHSEERAWLIKNIKYFKERLLALQLDSVFIPSDSAIQSAIIPGNFKVKEISRTYKVNGYDVRPILSPTVPAGSERLRFCIHSFNSEEEINAVLNMLVNFVR